MRSKHYGVGEVHNTKGYKLPTNTEKCYYLMKRQGLIGLRLATGKNHVTRKFFILLIENLTIFECGMVCSKHLWLSITHDYHLAVVL